MPTVDSYAAVRPARRDGRPICEIARTFGQSTRKVRAVLACPQPMPCIRRPPLPAPVLGTLHALIEALLADDDRARRSGATPPFNFTAACTTSMPTTSATATFATTSASCAAAPARLSFR